MANKPTKRHYDVYFYMLFCSSNCSCYPFRNLKTLFSPKDFSWWIRGFFSLCSERSWNWHRWFCQTGRAIFHSSVVHGTAKVQGMQPRGHVWAGGSVRLLLQQCLAASRVSAAPHIQQSPGHNFFPLKETHLLREPRLWFILSLLLTSSPLVLFIQSRDSVSLINCYH